MGEGGEKGGKRVRALQAFAGLGGAIYDLSSRGSCERVPCSLKPKHPPCLPILGRANSRGFRVCVLLTPLFRLEATPCRNAHQEEVISGP